MRKRLVLVLCLALTLSLFAAACEGEGEDGLFDDQQNGAPGTFNGTDGTNGTDGLDGTNGTDGLGVTPTPEDGAVIPPAGDTPEPNGQTTGLTPTPGDGLTPEADDGLTPTPDVGIPPMPTQQETAVVVLEEQEGSGLMGFAILRFMDDEAGGLTPTPENGVATQTGMGQTEVIVAVTSSSNGLLGGLFNGQEEDIQGTVAIHSGTCDEPGEAVYELRDLQRIEGVNAHVSASVVDADFNSLLTGNQVIAVMQMENGATPEAQNGAAQQQQDQQVIACGQLEQQATVNGNGTVPSPGTTPDDEPGLTPTP